MESENDSNTCLDINVLRNALKHIKKILTTEK